MLLRDEFNFLTKEEKKFEELIKKIEDSSKWIVIDAKEIKTSTASDINATSITSLEELDILTDTIENSGIYRTVNNEDYGVRISAMRSMEARNRIHGGALGDMTPEELSNTLNICAKYSKGDSLIRIMAGKISAELSSTYRILPQSEVFKTLKMNLEKDFNRVEFEMGYMDFSITSVKYNVFDQKVKAIINPSGTGNCYLIVKTNTSDTGYSGANIFFEIKDNGKSVFLSDGITLEHTGNASIEQFSDNCRKIMARVKCSIENLEKLKKISIEHPEACIRNLMTSAGEKNNRLNLSLKSCSQVLENRKLRYLDPTKPTTAYNIYIDICQLVDMVVMEKSANGYAISKLEEKIATLVTLKESAWKNADVVL